MSAAGAGARVLVVEDQPAVSKALTVLLEVNDIPAVAVSRPEEALELIDREELGVVLQDMNFAAGVTTGAEGLALFRRIRALDAELPVVAITAWTSLEAAVQMVKEGAADYLSKPWDDTKLVATVRNLLRLRALALENVRLRREKARAREDLSARHDLRGLVYESAAMHRVLALAVQVAPADVPVLITGPNGCGKDLVAEIIQANSRRRDRPFIKVNAGALPDQLLEAELFGAEPGAFTGSVKRRIGRFEAAQGGTLFLDEIGNLSPAGQAKLLRVLQSGEFERLGSSEARRVDVRVLAATNADLAAAIAAGRFREDLFFRLNVIELRVPPLHDRADDILPLATSFLARLGSGRPEGPPRLSAAAQLAVEEYGWPGNVRELLNRIQRALLVTSAATLEPGDLGLGHELDAPMTENGRDDTPADDGERGRLERLLRENEGMVSRAASKLGVSRQALYRRMQRLGIVIERRPR